MRLFTLAFSLFAFVGLAQANDTQIDQYRYGTKLDIARVLSIKLPKTEQTCQPVTAVMTYQDSNGEVRKLSYQVWADNCYNKN